jgi:glycerophosphodiester phosphodiesterase
VQLLFDLVPTYAGNRDKVVGQAIALLSSVRTNVGRGRSSLQGGVTLPFIEGASLNVIGTISFGFITITPFEYPNIRIGTNSMYWKTLITSRVIGHRGMVMNKMSRKSLQLGENTLASFIAAANLGASNVEMDVQLTKDNIPVIYYDSTAGETGIDAPMHTLTLEQVFVLCSGGVDIISSSLPRKALHRMTRIPQMGHRHRKHSLCTRQRERAFHVDPGV